jgi:hypothetical protein
MALTNYETWDCVAKLLEANGMPGVTPTFERCKRLFEYNCMIANVWNLDGHYHLLINKDWFPTLSNRSKPRPRGLSFFDGIDFELIPTSRTLYAIHYLELRECAFELELARNEWLGKSRWGIKVNPENSTFVWDGGNTRPFPLLPVLSPESMANRPKPLLSSR